MTAEPRLLLRPCSLVRMGGPAFENEETVEVLSTRISLSEGQETILSVSASEGSDDAIVLVVRLEGLGGA